MIDRDEWVAVAGRYDNAVGKPMAVFSDKLREEAEHAVARDGLEQRFRCHSPEVRFPIYPPELPDAMPDLDHFGAGAVALQRMLVQECGENIFLLPAWPANWDVDFKLHLGGNTIIEGRVVDGTLEDWCITPESRRRNVRVFAPQKECDMP